MQNLDNSSAISLHSTSKRGSKSGVEPQTENIQYSLQLASNNCTNEIVNSQYRDIYYKLYEAVATNKSLEIIKILINEGANVNLRNEYQITPFLSCNLYFLLGVFLIETFIPQTVNILCFPQSRVLIENNEPAKSGL